MSVAISIDNVIKRFGKDTIINGLSLDVRPGEFFTLLGPSGCGKTTLVRTLTGLIKPVSGRIELNGVPAKPRDLTRAGFLVMQDVNYQLFSDSVREELLIGLDETDAGITAQANQVMADLDLAAFAERHPMSLSGGQKQRVAIGSALMCGKDLIIFDEPTSGLDRYHMEQVGEDSPFRWLLAINPLPSRKAFAEGGLLSHLHFQYANDLHTLVATDEATGTETLRNPRWYATMCANEGTVEDRCAIIRALHHLQ